MSKEDVLVLEEKIKNLKDDFQEIKDALFKNGFVKKVVEHDLMIKGIKKQNWFIIGLCVSNLASMVYIILKGGLV